MIRLVNFFHAQINGDHGRAGRVGKGGKHGDSCYERYRWEDRDCPIFCERYDKFLFGMTEVNTFGPDGINDGLTNCHHRAAPVENHLKVLPMSNYEDVRLSIISQFGDQVDLRKFSMPTTTASTTTTKTTTSTLTSTTTFTKITSTSKSSQRSKACRTTTISTKKTSSIPTSSFISTSSFIPTFSTVSASIYPFIFSSTSHQTFTSL